MDIEESTKRGDLGGRAVGHTDHPLGRVHCDFVSRVVTGAVEGLFITIILNYQCRMV